MTADPVDPQNAFDLESLEFEAVRDALLDKLSSPLGRRGVRALAPLDDEDRVVRRLGCTRELVDRLAADDPVPLAGLVEVRAWLEAFFAGEHTPTTRDIADLRRMLRAAHRCSTWTRTRSDQPYLLAFGERMPDVHDLVEELSMIVDDRGEVLSSASPKLGEVRREIESAEAAVRAAVQRFLGDPSVHRYLQTPEPSWRHGRPVFQVRQEHRERVSGVTHDRSQSGATLFIEPSVVVKAANRLSDARAAEHREIQVILAHVCRGLSRNREDIQAAAVAVERLDVLGAAARLVSEEGYTVPEVGVDIPLNIRSGRHPILLRMDGVDVVPLELRLADPHTMLVVTGPNTGGKTVVLKTVGLLTMMAACGLPVPAGEGTQLPLLDGVYADIGDEQAITQNLSTFSSHVTRIARCLNRATARSLVLLDELGAGTDPEEGGSLGYAVLELLEKRGCLAVVTTHLGQLKEFAYRHAKAENGSMAFDGDTLRPLYRLDVGIPGQSHALDIAGQVGMPHDVVARARERLGKRDMTMEQAVQQVQATRRRAEADRKETDKLRGAMERGAQEMEKRTQELERRHLWLHEEADAVVEEQLRVARSLLDEELKTLRNAPKPYGDQATKLSGRLLDALGQTSVHRRRMKFLGGVRRDGIVYVPRLGRRCVVKKIDRVRETCTIEVGKMRLEIPFEDVSWLQPLDAGD